ncbi:MAG TPA: branched-chain amino acid ABC transporter permease [Planctomycetota bacterium]|jgi:branched-chain amino acid transport system permease protein|nr:branched-chain amino acid ABC transporter permease [Planctomycetota bacterium]
MLIFLQQLINGLTTGTLFALIAIGYTMVYGIIELINFAHGDLFMLGAFLALTIVSALGLEHMGPAGATGGIVLTFVLCMAFCALLNFLQDRIIYRPIRNAPKLTPLVSAIGVSFVFMGIGQIWKGVADINFPDVIPNKNLLGTDSLRFTAKDLLVILVTTPLMAGLTVFVRFTKLGKAMRATAQNPTAARLMGIDVDRVIGWTFAIGGLLAGAASVIYGLTINTVSFQMGYQNGLYAFTAAVLGGIGNLPGAMLGGIVIGLVRSLGSQYVGEQWTSALVFAILILLLVFRPSGLLGTRTREKV